VRRTLRVGSWRLAPALAVLALLAAGCHGRCPNTQAGRCISFACGRFAANQDRTAFAFFDDTALTLLRDGQIRRMPLAAQPCGAGGGHLWLSPDGWQALVYGTGANIPGDLWGHSGRHVTDSCLWDLRAGTARAPDAGAAAWLAGSGRPETPWLHWGARRGLLYALPQAGDLHLRILDRADGRTADLKPELEAGLLPVCDVSEGDGDVTIACLTSHSSPTNRSDDPGPQQVQLRRYDLRTWPPAPGPILRVPIGRYSAGRALRFSADGRRLAYLVQTDVKQEGNVFASYLAQRLGVGRVDPRAGAHLRSWEFIGQTGLAVEHEPGGEGLLTAEVMGVPRKNDHGLIRRFSAAGVQTAAYSVETPPWAGLAWPPAARHFWSVSACEATRVKF
jgi:hypothetical protein